MLDRRLIHSATGRRLFGHWSLGGALIIAVGAALLPPDGLGFEVCWVKHSLGLPCLGCGLTRSVACIAHGRVGDAFAYNPFGFLVLGFAALCLAAHLTPATWRKRLGAWLRLHDPRLGRAYMAICLGFIAFGFVRMGLVACDAWPGPNLW